MICNPEDLTPQQVCDAVAITWAEVNYVSKYYTRDVLKIDPATTGTNHLTFQRRAQSKTIASWIQGCFGKEYCKYLLLKSNNYQWNIPVSNVSRVKCDGPTVIKLMLGYIQPSTMVGTEHYRKAIQTVASKGITDRINLRLFLSSCP